MLLLSGILLPLTFAPGWLQAIAEWNPFSWAVDAARALFAGDPGDRRVAGAGHHRALAARRGVWAARTFARSVRLSAVADRVGPASCRASSRSPLRSTSSDVSRSRRTLVAPASVGAVRLTSSGTASPGSPTRSSALRATSSTGSGRWSRCCATSSAPAARVASLHGTAFAVGGVVGGTVFPALVRRYGRPAVIWLGLAGVAPPPSACGPRTARRDPDLARSRVAVGGVARWSTASSPRSPTTTAPAGPAAISEANAVAAGVGVVAPLVVGARSRPASAGVRAWPSWSAVAVLALVALDFPGYGHQTAPFRRAPDGRRAAGCRGAYWLAWTSLFATGSVEVCLNLWVGDVLRTHAGVSPGVATAALSAIIGRDVRRPARRRPAAAAVSPPTRVLLGALGARARPASPCSGGHRPWLAMSGLVVCGLGNAPALPARRSALAVAHSRRAARPGGRARRVRDGVVVRRGAVRARVRWPTRSARTPAFLLVPAFLAAVALVAIAAGRATRPPVPVSAAGRA